MSSNEIEFVVKNLSTKETPGQIFHWQILTFKEEKNQFYTIAFGKQKKRKHFLHTLWS